MATKPQQLHKLIKIRATLVKFKLSVKSVDPVLENLLKRDKPPLDAKLLREIESMLQDRQYLKSSRLQTTEIDREICQLLENLHKPFSSDTTATPSDLHTKEHPQKATGPEPNSKKDAAETLSSDTPAPPPEVHTKEHSNKATRPEPNPKKRAAANPPSSEPHAKKPRLATSPRAAKEHIGPGRPSMQTAKITVPPWPLRTVRLRGNVFLIGDKTCSPVIDIDQQDQSFRVYDEKKGFLNQGATFRFQATTNTKILCSRPEKQVLISGASAEINLRFVSVKYLDQVVTALQRNRSRLMAEHSTCSSWPRLKPDDSEKDSFSQVKKEDVQCKGERSGGMK